MFRVSVSKNLTNHKKFLKDLFDAITVQALVQTGLVHFKKAMHDEIDTIIIETLNSTLLPAIRQNLINNKSIFTSTLYNSLHFSSTKPGQVVLEASKSTGNREYAVILERGSKPRTVDQAETDNIVRWVLFKRKVSEERAISAANMVVRKIQKTGNVPHPYIEPALQLMMPIIKQVVAERLRTTFGAV